MRFSFRPNSTRHWLNLRLPVCQFHEIQIHRARLQRVFGTELDAQRAAHAQILIDLRCKSALEFLRLNRHAAHLEAVTTPRADLGVPMSPLHRGFWFEEQARRPADD